MHITQDIHCHTYLSVCGEETATIAYYVDSATQQGLTTIGIADHLWDREIPFPASMRTSLFSQGGELVVDWYRAQDAEHCRQILRQIAQTDTKGIRFLFGAEAEYCPGMGVALTEEKAAAMDYLVVPNSHTHHLMDSALYIPYEKHGQYMLQAAMEICTCPLRDYVTTLAHPFEAVECPYPVEYIIDTITDAQLCQVFSAAKEANIAVEINTGVYRRMHDHQIRNHYMLRILEQAKKSGCKFTFGSDCHRAGDHDSFGRVAKLVAEYLQLTQDDILQL